MVSRAMKLGPGQVAKHEEAKRKKGNREMKLSLTKTLGFALRRRLCLFPDRRMGANVHRQGVGRLIGDI